MSLLSNISSYGSPIAIIYAIEAAMYNCMYNEYIRPYSIRTLTLYLALLNGLKTC